MSDRIDEEIHSLVKKGNFKACLEKVNQLQKQLPNSSYLKVLEIYVKFKQSPGKFNYENMLGRFYGINGTEITSDTRALNLLHKFFVEIGRYDEALHVYESANFKYQSFDVALQWFEKALDDSNYKQMTRACQQLAKLGGDHGEGLSSRDFFFWYALSIIALFKYQSHKVSDQERKLLPQLAYRSLCNVKPFRSKQEIYVFCSVCEELFPNNEQKSQDIVQEVIVQLEKSVDLHLKKFLLKHLNVDDNTTTFDICGKLLRQIDDFELITRFIQSGKNLSKDRDEIQREIESRVGDSRNSRLARIEIDYTFDNKISEEALMYYLKRFHNKPCCSVDLNHYRGSLDDAMMRNAFNALNDNDVFHEYNLFKLGLSECDPITAYNKHKVTLKDKPETDYSACSLFISNIVKDLISKDQHPTLEKVLLALTLLENYQTHDVYNYDVAVWLIAIYMYLGCVPLAYSLYLELKIKNIQIDTIDFLIYSRFSTLYPHKPHEYIQQLHEKNEKFYNSSVSRLPQLIQIGLERKSYSKFLGMLEFRDRLQRSSMKWMMTSESIQLARLCSDKRGEQLQHMHEDWRVLEMVGDMDLSDNRDWKIFGPEVQKQELPHVLEYLSVSDKSIALKCVREFMIELITLRETDERLDSFLESLMGSTGLERTLRECFGSSDVWSFQVFYDLYKNEGADLMGSLERLDLGSQSTSTWKMPHDYLTKLHTLKTLDGFKRIKDPRIKQVIKKKISDLRDSCDDLFSMNLSEITAACEALRAGDSAELLKNLGYVPLDPSNLTKCLRATQKTIRNL